MSVFISALAVDVDIEICNNFLSDLLCIFSFSYVSFFDIFPSATSPCNISGMRHVSNSFNSLLIFLFPLDSLLQLYLSVALSSLVFGPFHAYDLSSIFLCSSLLLDISTCLSPGLCSITLFHLFFLLHFSLFLLPWF